MSLKDDLRTALGSPTTQEFTDAEAALCVSRAIAEYSRYRPIVVLDKETLETVKDQQEYDLSEISGLVEVRECIWERGVVLPEELGVEGLPTAATKEYRGLNVFDDPSLLKIYQYKVAELRKALEESWEELEGTLFLFPTPSQSGGEIWLIYTKQRTESEISGEDLPDVLTYAEALGRRTLAGHAGITKIGGVSFDKKMLLTEAERLEKKFYSRYADMSYATRT